MAKAQHYGTGRRKESVARMFLRPGKGNILVNGREFEEYFTNPLATNIVRKPLNLTETEKQFDIYVTVRGGGLSGQAEAIRHGIARALLQYDPDLRSTLKTEHLLTRDSRVKERRKFGQKGARAKFQHSKR